MEAETAKQRGPASLEWQRLTWRYFNFLDAQRPEALENMKQGPWDLLLGFFLPWSPGCVPLLLLPVSPCVWDGRSLLMGLFSPFH